MLCVEAFKLDASQLLKSDEYCDKVIREWKVLVDWVKYLTPEHQQKEREYGIPWRSAFKQEMHICLQNLCLELYNNKSFLDGKDPFLGLIELVAYSKQEVDSFNTNTQPEKISQTNNY